MRGYHHIVKGKLCCNRLMVAIQFMLRSVVPFSAAISFSEIDCAPPPTADEVSAAVSCHSRVSLIRPSWTKVRAFSKVKSNVGLVLFLHCKGKCPEYQCFA